MPTSRELKLSVLRGPSGYSVYLGRIRIAGPKPLGAATIAEVLTTEAYVQEALTTMQDSVARDVEEFKHRKGRA